MDYYLAPKSSECKARTVSLKAAFSRASCAASARARADCDMLGVMSPHFCPVNLLTTITIILD